MNSIDKTAVCTDITHELTKLPTVKSGCTIYIVHKPLRDVNHKAYEPEVIAIGPYHRNKGTHLKMMEEHKVWYLRILVEREGGNNLETYVSAIGELEKEARSCYAETIPLSPEEFTKMLLLDGCFIVELIRRFNNANLREENDPMFNLNWIMKSLKRDLILFENQIPFFILCKLFDLIEGPNKYKDFTHQIFCFLHELYPGKVRRQMSTRSPDNIRHLLDLLHNNWLPFPNSLNLGGKSTNDMRESLQFVKNIAGLREANLKLKRSEGESSLFDVRFHNGTLSLPHLTIDDRTESVFRNLIAYEQYFHDFQCSFLTDYAKFMNCFVDSSRDVEILTNRKIITNWLGNDEVVADMFNKLTDSVTKPEDHFLYAEMVEGVNNHCNKRVNNGMARLRRNYWNSPWVLVAILVAVILLLLNVTQTVFSILQVVLHKTPTP